MSTPASRLNFSGIVEPIATSGRERYDPPADWSISNSQPIKDFFKQKFGRDLPIANFGQGEIHNKWHYDHRNAMDVSLNPSSAEGQSLISYLQQNSIPFQAFTKAIPGVATGAHIHIGRPSKKTSESFDVGATTEALNFDGIVEPTEDAAQPEDIQTEKVFSNPKTSAIPEVPGVHRFQSADEQQAREDAYREDIKRANYMRVEVPLPEGYKDWFDVPGSTLARQALFQQAIQSGVPADYAIKWIGQKADQGKVNLYDLQTGQSVEPKDLMGREDAYDVNRRVMIIHQELPQVRQMKEDYEKQKGSLQNIKDTYNDPNMMAGEKFFFHYAPASLDIATRPLQAASTGIAGLQRNLSTTIGAAIGDPESDRLLREGAYSSENMGKAMVKRFTTGEVEAGYEQPIAEGASDAYQAYTGKQLPWAAKLGLELVGDPTNYIIPEVPGVGKTAANLARRTALGEKLLGAGEKFAPFTELKIPNVPGTTESAIKTAASTVADIPDVPVGTIPRARIIKQGEGYKVSYPANASASVGDTASLAKMEVPDVPTPTAKYKTAVLMEGVTKDGKSFYQWELPNEKPISEMFVTRKEAISNAPSAESHRDVSRKLIKELDANRAQVLASNIDLISAKYHPAIDVMTNAGVKERTGVSLELSYNPEKFERLDVDEISKAFPSVDKSEIEGLQRFRNSFLGQKYFKVNVAFKTDEAARRALQDVAGLTEGKTAIGQVFDAMRAEKPVGVPDVPVAPKQNEVLNLITGERMPAPPSGESGAFKVPKSNLPKGYTTKSPNPPAVQKIIDLVEQAKPVETATSELYSKARGLRLGAFTKAFEQGGEQGAKAAMSMLRGKLPTAGFNPIRQALTQSEADSLFDIIRDSPKLKAWDRPTALGAMQKLLDPSLMVAPTRGELSVLEKAFGQDFVKAILSKRSLGSKAFEEFLGATNLFRAIQTSFDISAPLRQGLVLTTTHPFKASKAFVAQIRAMGSEGAANAVKDAIENSPLAKVRHDAGLYLSEWGGTAQGLAEREEAFMSQFAQKISGVKQSERAYVTYLNKLRADVFDSFVAAHPNANPKDLEGIADFINLATGRGSLGRFEQSAPALANLFYSPRFAMSRIQLPGTLIKGTKASRLFAARHLVQFVGTGVSILTLAKMGGASVELDPRSSDFGKIRVGKTAIDIWGGFQQTARFTAQMIAGERKSATTGLTSEMGEGMNPSRADTAIDFIRGKASPQLGILWDTADKKNAVGQKRNIYTAMGDRIMPLGISDLYEAIAEDKRSGGSGWKGGLLGSPALVGAGVQTQRTSDEPVAFEVGRKILGMNPKSPITDRQETKKTLVRQGRAGDNVSDVTNQAKSQGVISPKDARSIRREIKQTDLQNAFEKLSIEQALDAYEGLDADKQKQVKMLLVRKQRGIKDLPANDRKRVQARFRSVLSGVPAVPQ